FAVGCSKDEERLSVDVGDESSSTVESTAPVVTETGINPLTGLKDLDNGKENNRPVAITINNVKVAQPVQTGLNKADIVYETEVEYGITRLVAVFQDISKVTKIGTVRSARYPFIDIAMGHNAIYVHHGQDNEHAAPHLNDLDRYVLPTKNEGERVNNGLAQEHTLYAKGDKLWETLSQKFNVKNNTSDTWVKFADEDVTFEKAAKSVKVPFTTAATSTFKYDEASKKYVRYFYEDLRKDYVTGETMSFKNVFVLSTNIYDYPGCKEPQWGKGPHQKVELESGTGYYFVNGTYTTINWKKGASTNSFKFTDAEGKELVVQPGNMWICIADKSAVPVIE
ncbi:MAG: DUF3048 domain-containing protein, partial [Clostridia bacterium]|nr:DUF3048 domain-containing protein [Clostridia bacterium]